MYRESFDSFGVALDEQVRVGQQIVWGDQQMYCQDDEQEEDRQRAMRLCPLLGLPYEKMATSCPYGRTVIAGSWSRCVQGRGGATVDAKIKSNNYRRPNGTDSLPQATAVD